MVHFHFFCVFRKSFKSNSTKNCSPLWYLLYAEDPEPMSILSSIFSSSYHKQIWPLRLVSEFMPTQPLHWSTSAMVSSGIHYCLISILSSNASSSCSIPWAIQCYVQEQVIAMLAMVADASDVTFMKGEQVPLWGKRHLMCWGSNNASYLLFL